MYEQSQRKQKKDKQRANRPAKLRQYYQLRKADESPQNKLIRIASANVQDKRKRMYEDEAERSIRLVRLREYIRKRRDNETVFNKNIRLKRIRQNIGQQLRVKALVKNC